MQDTRQDPRNRPDLKEPPTEPIEDNTTVSDVTEDLVSLVDQRATLEHYRDQVASAGADGLDPIASKLMVINLKQLKLLNNGRGLESFNSDTTITLEDFSEWLGNLGEKIKALITKLIELAKNYASQIMSGAQKVKSDAEDLMESMRGRNYTHSSRKPANELHEGEQVINLDNASILFSDGELCLGECKSEQEVIKFFTQMWPRYAKEQVGRAKKMIAEYDVESGNSENFETNIGFLGNHASLVANVTKAILPGNKQIAFKYVALGPELVDAEDADTAPDTYSLTVRTTNEINNTLKQNVATMNALGAMFKAEASVLNEMSSLSDTLMGLENRRGETVWKSARAGLDDISKAMMELITKLKPGYDPIVRHIAAIGNARNAVCRKELSALGQ